MEQKHRFVILAARSNRSVDSAKSSVSAAKVAISGGNDTAKKASWDWRKEHDGLIVIPMPPMRPLNHWF